MSKEKTTIIHQRNEKLYFIGNMNNNSNQAAVSEQEREGWREE